MKFKSRFNLGDKVYYVGTRTTRQYDRCQACGGAGRVEINGNTFSCNACSGLGRKELPWKEEWFVSDKIGTIGMIRAELTDAEWVSGKEERFEETYMIDISGVVSGTVHNVSNLFTTREEAEAECIKRNEKKRSES